MCLCVKTHIMDNSFSVSIPVGSRGWPKRYLCYCPINLSLMMFKLKFYAALSPETIRAIRDGHLDFHAAPEL